MCPLSGKLKRGLKSWKINDNMVNAKKSAAKTPKKPAAKPAKDAKKPAVKAVKKTKSPAKKAAKKSPAKKAVTKKTCPEGSKLNPETGNCNKVKSPAPCEKGSTRSLETGRCNKIVCPEGSKLNPLTGNCNKTPVKKPCEEGSKRNADTGRCNKTTVCKEGYKWSPKAGKCVIMDFPSVTTKDGKTKIQRSFKIVMTSVNPSVKPVDRVLSKNGGRYIGQNPTQAAKKAYTHLCNARLSAGTSASDKCEISFDIRETTRGTGKSVHSYTGIRKKLAKPELITRVLTPSQKKALAAAGKSTEDPKPYRIEFKNEVTARK